MNRFVFEFEGKSSLDEYEFFAGRTIHPEKIYLEDVSKELDGVSVDSLLNEWNLAVDINVILRDTETGAIWQNTGDSWHLIQDRALLPGEQRLF